MTSYLKPLILLGSLFSDLTQRFYVLYRTYNRIDFYSTRINAPICQKFITVKISLKIFLPENDILQNLNYNFTKLKEKLRPNQSKSKIKPKTSFTILHQIAYIVIQLKQQHVCTTINHTYNLQPIFIYQRAIQAAQNNIYYSFIECRFFELSTSSVALRHCGCCFQTSIIEKFEFPVIEIFCILDACQKETRSAKNLKKGSRVQLNN